MRWAVKGLLLANMVGCASPPPSDAEVPGWSQTQAQEYFAQRELVSMMRRNDSALPAAIRRQAEKSAGSGNVEAEERRIRTSVRATMLAEDDREAVRRCQAHWQPFVAPLIIAVPLTASMRSDAEACVNNYRATGQMPDIAAR